MDDSDAPRNHATTLLSGMRLFLTRLAQCLRFYSRLPIPALPWEDDPHIMPDFAAMAVALPVAGLVIGCFGALFLSLSLWAGLPSWPTATLAIATTAFVTCAFHEDGLADTADGFGGGATRERRLVIMKDSLIGSFGASALILGFLLRIGGLAAVIDRSSVAQSCVAFLLAASLSRVAGLAVVALAPPARMEGAAYAAGQLDLSAYVRSCLVLFAVLAVLGLPFFPISGLTAIVAVSAFVVYGLTSLSVRLIGGQTGDVAGAAQQLSEAACFLILAIFLRPIA